MTIDYKTAGVDIAAGNEAVKRIKRAVESTFSSNVLTQLGSFGAMYDISQIVKDYKHPVLVQSVDGVGTKMMVAKMMGKYDTIGADLVSATVNDIVVLGAKPLTLLDYIANDKLNPLVIEEIVTGMAKACRASNISLVGGETAEMPGTYLPGEHDLVGIVTGILDKDKAVLGDRITLGDVLLAFPSSGLHTNGYSLARKLLFDIAGYTVHTYLDQLGMTVGEALLATHINYTEPVLHLLACDIDIKGMAHITGGGVLENIPRVLPKQLAVEINKFSMPVLPIFKLLVELGQLPDEESYRTFNMGIGYVMVVAAESVEAVRVALKTYTSYPVYEIGRVVVGDQSVRLI